MGERGSFCTEFFYCPECYAQVKRVLYGADLQLFPSIVVAGAQTPIIAGYVKSIVGGGEFTLFDHDLRESIEKAICHPFQMAVLSENRKDLLKFEPIEKSTVCQSLEKVEGVERCKIDHGPCDGKRRACI